MEFEFKKKHKNWNRIRSYKLEGRIRKVPFFSDSTRDSETIYRV